MLFQLFRPVSQGGKRSIFLTNTTVLAHQQAEVLSKTTPLKVAVYTGDMNVDAWNKDKWFKEFDDNQVFIVEMKPTDFTNFSTHSNIFIYSR